MKNLSESIMKNLKESSNKHKLKEEVDLSKQLDYKVIKAKKKEIRRALKEYFTKAGYEVLGVKDDRMSTFIVQVYLSKPEYDDIYIYIGTRFGEFRFNALQLVGTDTVDTDDLGKLNKLAKVASNINNSLNLLDIIR